MKPPRTFWTHGTTGVEPRRRQKRDRAQELQNNWEPVGHQFCRGSHQELWNLWSHQGSAGALGATKRTSGAAKLREPGGIPVVLQGTCRTTLGSRKASGAA